MGYHFQCLYILFALVFFVLSDHLMRDIWCFLTYRVTLLFIVCLMMIFLWWCTTWNQPKNSIDSGQTLFVSGIDISDEEKMQISTIWADGMDLQEIKSLYQEYKLSDDIMWEINIIRYLYELHPTPKLQTLLIDKYLELYQYDQALELSQALIATEKKNPVIIEQYLFILFNSYQLTQSNLPTLDRLITALYDQGSITMDQLNFYRSLLSILSLDQDQFEWYMIALSDSGHYTDIKYEALDMIKVYHWYKDSPPYYLHSLLSKVFFQHGYFKIADLLAQYSIWKKSDYILPLQILSYSSLLQQKYKQSSRLLSKLVTTDAKHSELYRMLLWIAHYEQQKYDDTVVYLTQIKKWIYYPLALRYLMLSYNKLQQYTKVIDTMQLMLWSKTINDYDYYYIFDTVLYSNDRQLYDINPFLIAQYIDQCVSSIWADNPICTYGQAGMYHITGDRHRAYTTSLKILKYFPLPKLYVRIAQYYESEGNTAKAKLYYIKAMTQSSSTSEKNEIKQILTTLSS